MTVSVDHPWREYAGPLTHKCRRCGEPISQTIVLCDACKRRFNVWFSDDKELRFIEMCSLDMESGSVHPMFNGHGSFRYDIHAMQYHPRKVGEIR
jgi:hypothetical protein